MNFHLIQILMIMVTIDGNLERQKRLIDDLNRLSNRIQQKLKSWEWFVRKNALAEREKSYKRYANLA